MAITDQMADMVGISSITSIYLATILPPVKENLMMHNYFDQLANQPRVFYQSTAVS